VSAINAYDPSGDIAIEVGFENFAFVPMPSTNPAEPWPATVEGVFEVLERLKE
jgi:hypothetical protein